MDKFGHHIYKRLRLSDFLESIDKPLTLVKEENGEIDLQSKRLTGIIIPLKANDAVNKEYVDKQSESYASKQEVHDLFNTIKTDIQNCIQQFKQDFCTKADLNKIKILSIKDE